MFILDEASNGRAACLHNLLAGHEPRLTFLSHACPGVGIPELAGRHWVDVLTALVCGRTLLVWWVSDAEILACVASAVHMAAALERPR
jgi:hypothetical protein